MTSSLTFPKPRKEDRKKRKPYDGDPLLEDYYPGISKVSQELYDAVKERSKNVCEICGKRKAKEVHHLAKRRRKAWLGNLIDLCWECHNRPGSMEAIHHNEDVYDREMLKLQNKYFEMGYSGNEVKYLLGTKDMRLFGDEPRLNKGRNNARAKK